MIPRYSQTVRLFVEVVPDRVGSWRQGVRAGRVFKRRPDEYEGRLVEVSLVVPAGYLEGAVKVELPVDDPAVEGSAGTA